MQQWRRLFFVLVSALFSLTPQAHAMDWNACLNLFGYGTTYEYEILNRAGRDPSLGKTLRQRETELLERIKTENDAKKLKAAHNFYYKSTPPRQRPSIAIKPKDLFRFRSADLNNYLQDAEANMALHAVWHPEHRKFVFKIADQYLPSFNDTSFLLTVIFALENGYDIAEVSVAMDLFLRLDGYQERPAAFDHDFIAYTAHASFYLSFDELLTSLSTSQADGKVDWEMFSNNAYRILDSRTLNAPNPTTDIPFSSYLDHPPRSMENLGGLVPELMEALEISANEAYAAIQSAARPLQALPGAFRPNFDEVVRRYCAFHTALCKRSRDERIKIVCKALKEKRSLANDFVTMLSPDFSEHDLFVKRMQWLLTSPYKYRHNLLFDRRPYYKSASMGRLQHPHHFFDAFLEKYFDRASVLEHRDLIWLLRTYLELMTLANDSPKTFDRLLSKFNILGNRNASVSPSNDTKMDLLSEVVSLLKTYPHDGQQVRSLISDISSENLLGVENRLNLRDVIIINNLYKAQKNQHQQSISSVVEAYVSGQIMINPD